MREALVVAWPRAVERAARPEHRSPPATRFRNAVFEGKLPAFPGFDSKPICVPGGPTTPNQVRVVEIGGQRAMFGAAGRLLVDMSRPGAWYCLPGGASERRFGPGYAGGLDAWARGDFAPLGPASGPAPRAGDSPAPALENVASEAPSRSPGA